MSITVYLISGSAPAWRVLLSLETKGLSYRSHILQTSKKEQKQDWFLELNPRGQIPLLQDGEITISESLAIMHYLDKKYPDPTLFGSNPEQAARIEQTVHEVLSYTDKVITAFVQPVFRNKVEEQQDGFVQVAEGIHQELRVIEDKISQTEWLGDERFSAADIVFIPTMQRLLRATNKAAELAHEIGLGNLNIDYPNLMLWNTKVEKLSAFQATFPPHWRE